MSASSRPTLQPELFQREREIDGSGRLADAALARGDGDDIGDARQAAGAMACIARGAWPGEGEGRLRRRLLPPLPLPLPRWLTGARSAVSVTATPSTPGTVGHRLLGGLAQGFELPRASRVDGDGEIDLALVDHDLRDEAERDDVVAKVGALDALQRLEHALFGEVFGHDSGYLCLLRANTNCLVASAGARIKARSSSGRCSS